MSELDVRLRRGGGAPFLSFSFHLAPLRAQSISALVSAPACPVKVSCVPPIQGQTAERPAATLPLSARLDRSLRSEGNTDHTGERHSYFRPRRPPLSPRWWPVSRRAVRPSVRRHTWAGLPRAGRTRVPPPSGPPASGATGSCLSLFSRGECVRVCV